MSSILPILYYLYYTIQYLHLQINTSAVTLSESVKSFGEGSSSQIGIRDLTKALKKAKKSTPRHVTTNPNDHLLFKYSNTETVPPSPLHSSNSTTETLQRSGYLPPKFPWWSNGQLNVPDFKKPPFGEFAGFTQYQSNDTANQLFCRQVIRIL